MILGMAALALIVVDATQATVSVPTSHPSELEAADAFQHDGHAIELHAGDLLHLCPRESHALKGIADFSVLVTRLRPRAEELPEQFPPH